jgi:formylglycine-generating enzyme
MHQFRKLAIALLLQGLLSGQDLSAKDPPAPPSAEIENSIGIKLVEIPAGEFMMGSSRTAEEIVKNYPGYNDFAPNHLHDETPSHKVRITKAFYLGKYEITRAQFAKFVEATKYVTEPEADKTGALFLDYEKKQFSKVRAPQYNWKNPSFPQEDNHPVVNVTWNDVNRFCEWLSKTEGKKYRLPTEAEWEYSCRAGSTSDYFFGNDPKELVKFANVGDATGFEKFKDWAYWEQPLDVKDGFIFTAPVGSFPPNKFGLHDMHGNVWEWVSDYYDENYYKNSPVDDPQGPAEGRLRIRRGGAWHTFPLWTRSSFRNWHTPRTRYLNQGFRVVLEKAPPAK